VSSRPPVYRLSPPQDTRKGWLSGALRSLKIYSAASQLFVIPQRSIPRRGVEGAGICFCSRQKKGDGSGLQSTSFRLPGMLRRARRRQLVRRSRLVIATVVPAVAAQGCHALRILAVGRAVFLPCGGRTCTRHMGAFIWGTGHGLLLKGPSASGAEENSPNLSGASSGLPKWQNSTLA
jgi:hypothetical protein